MSVRRIASVIGLPPENVEVYDRYHADVWPGVLDALRRHNVCNYSIYRHGDLLFSYMEYTGDDYEADMAGIAADPVTQEWWSVMEPLQRPLDDRAEGEWWKTLPEVFHLD
ncbi:L-rhamnose mutarotase [Microbacterium aquimaris]|uniref:L-rhamnose mutarotase n=1 Tax=Microbacterium aquimaris TaxID=459816 RepID=A0ABU5N2S4_9MICO|nr:L-rhamnose mutarotase [Microbacterium aquimaris]MDZ8160363.1 L-rhamnose mutarotase [Microbacterium aquimaris]